MPATMPELPGVRHREVETSRVRFHVAETGPSDGEPLLLVHGWPQNWWCWNRVVSRLDARHRCVMPDLPGFGWSEPPRGGFEKEALAGDLLELLGVMGIERVGWVGHDWGAICGFLAALRAPERFRGLLALSVPHAWPSRHDRTNPWRLLAFVYQPPLATPGLAPWLMESGLTSRALKAGAAPGTFTETDLAVYERTMGSSQGGRTTMGMYRTSVLRELPGAVAGGRYRDARLEMPARLVVGEKDMIVRGADLRGHEDNAPNMTVHWIAGAGHFLPEERPQAVTEHVEALFGGDGAVG